MELTCINCPVGCRMKVAIQDGQVTEVIGNQCKRGAVYAKQECVDPQRMITAVIPVKGSKVPLSVKTRTPVPKKMIFACMDALAQVCLTAPVAAGAVVLANICDTGVDVVATKSV